MWYCDKCKLYFNTYSYAQAHQHTYMHIKFTTATHKTTEMWKVFFQLSRRKVKTRMCKNVPEVEQNGLLARNAKLGVAHAPGMPGAFSSPLRVSDPNMHHDTPVTHVPWCMLGSLISGFLWIRWREKCSWHSRRMCNPQVCVSGKRLIAPIVLWVHWSYFWNCSWVVTPLLFECSRLYKRNSYTFGSHEWRHVDYIYCTTIYSIFSKTIYNAFWRMYRLSDE